MRSENDERLMILLVDDAPANIQMLNETLKDEYNYECLLKAADNALYQAKQEGRNRIVSTQTLYC